MAAKPSSLLDDADFSRIGQSKEEQRKASGGGGKGGGQGLKLAFVALCFVIGGLGIAYEMNLFPESKLPSTIPGGHGALTSSDKAAAEQQKKKAAEDMTNPEINHGLN